MSIVLKDLTTEQLHDRLACVGLTPRQTRQIHAAVMRRGTLPATDEGIAEKSLDEVGRRTAIPNLEWSIRRFGAGRVRQISVSRRWPARFEAVRIPLLHRPEDLKYVVCVSSQVGCAMRCAFCATGRMGFRRNLAAWEIVDQVIKIQDDSPHPVRGVVFMGMGEPMLNYDGVIQAARILSEPSGMAISGKAITISTVGIVPGIRRFTEEGHIYRLVVSLNSADPLQRRELMPVEGTHSTGALIEAMREYHAVTGRRVILAWTMMAGVNTREEDAQMLAELTRGLPIKIDLIDVNNPTADFGRPRAPNWRRSAMR